MQGYKKFSELVSNRSGSMNSGHDQALSKKEDSLTIK